MMSWSPTARRNAVSGAVHLFWRSAWRESPHGPALRNLVEAALRDEDRVVRLHAARVIRRLHPDNGTSCALVRERLLAEPEDHVAATLTNELAALAGEEPTGVDEVIRELLASPRWQARLAVDDVRHLDTVDPLISLALWLAIRHGTPTATKLVEDWFARPTAGPAGRRAVSHIREWLALPPARTADRRKAFELIRTMATALKAVRRAEEPIDKTEVYKLADALVDQVYFASGAFGTMDNERVPIPADDEFAHEAFAVLDLLTEFRHPTIVHPIVQTLAHLSPSEPLRAFIIVERAISAGDPYTYDTLAADTVVGLVERYLAEFRDTVASDPELLTAVRRVLDAFVRVGWPAAVSLSYRLGDAFR